MSSVQAVPNDQARQRLIGVIKALAQKYRGAPLLVALLLVAGAGYGYESSRRERAEVKRRSSEVFRRNSAVILEDGSREIFVPYKGGQARVVVKPTRDVVFEAHRRLFLDKRNDLAGHSEGRVGVNRRFIKQFNALWAIIVPRARSKEVVIIMLQVLALLARTYLSLIVAELDGRIVRDLVSKNGKGFTKGIIYWLLIAIPASYTNSLIRFLQSKMAIAFRTRLTRYIHDLYLNQKLPYYKIHLDGTIESTDQYITSDVTHFCDAAAAIFSNIGKPMVDFVVFNYQLYRTLGSVAVMFMFASYMGTASVLRRVSPPFGRLAAAENRLEGEFRSAHARIITNAEEIAFYHGADREKTFLDRTYAKLAKHVNGIYRIRIGYNMFEDFVIKYGWSAIGLIACSIPVFAPTLPSLVANNSEKIEQPQSTLAIEGERTQSFITNKRLMLSLGDAGGRLMYSYKDLAELAGHTSRVFSLLSTLHRVNANAYYPLPGEEPELFSLADVQGTLQEGFDGIRFENVPIAIPGGPHSMGEQLIDDLNITIRKGEHILISGPNGVGKTSISRVVAGLWPIFRGLVSKPKEGDIIFLPQRPYFSMGSLRDQLIYPHSHADMIESGRTDADLEAILKIVKLEYLPSREGGLNVVKGWKDVFSGGEKQRMQIGRVFYHRPSFVILDEATSAVSADVEAMMYQSAKDAGITLITISHRPTLVKYHAYELKLGTGEDGKGWMVDRIGSEQEQLSVERSIKDLEAKLSQVEGWTKRRAEIEKELHIQSN